jgi:hypothetical protein
MLGILDCIADFQVPQAAEWQRIGNQIDAAFIPVRFALKNPLRDKKRSAFRKIRQTALR